MLEYVMEKDGAGTVCRFKGALSNEYLEELKNIVSEAFAGSEADFSFELNFEGVTKIDPQHVKLICRAHRISRKLDGTLKVKGFRSDVLGPVVRDMDLKNFATCSHYGVDECLWRERCRAEKTGAGESINKSAEALQNRVEPG